MYFSAFEFAVFGVDVHRDAGCQASQPHDAHATGAEIAQAVGDEVAFVKFDGSYHMRTGAKHHISASVDAKVGECAQVATVATVEILHSGGEVARLAALCAAMEIYNHHIGFLTHLLHNAFHRSVVEKRGIVMLRAESGETVGHALNFLICGECVLIAFFCRVFRSSETDLCISQRLLGVGDRCAEEVVDMIVGKREKIKTGVFQVLHIAWGHLEHESQFAFGIFARFAHLWWSNHALKIATGDICFLENGCNIVEKMFAIAHRQAVGWPSVAHHNIAHKCESHLLWEAFGGFHSGGSVGVFNLGTGDGVAAFGATHQHRHQAKNDRERAFHFRVAIKIQ